MAIKLELKTKTFASIEVPVDGDDRITQEDFVITVRRLAEQMDKSVLGDMERQSIKAQLANVINNLSPF